MAGTIPVSVVVPVKNEEANLAKCLDALRRFTEVIVVDSMSTDATASIARSYGARVLQFQWSGMFPKKRNWVLLNHKLANAWVLFLDADEIVDTAFCDALVAAISDTPHDGFWLTYTTHFLGRKLRYGKPLRKLALFRVGKGLYERIDEDAWSRLDMEVHEHPIIHGSVGEIVTPIDHCDAEGIYKLASRHLDYAAWEARRFLKLRSDGIAHGILTPQQRFKYAHIHRWWYPWAYFIQTYVVQLGFLDGAAGFHFAFIKAWYFNIIRLLIREHHAKTAEPKSERRREPAG
jgi:glycosyltransferase involved in cell wall biosynthesis